MCEYCKYDPDNDVYPEPFAYEDLVSLRNKVEYEVEVNRYGGKKELAVTYSEGFQWYEIVSAPINFCPMCGEKIVNKEEQN